MKARYVLAPVAALDLVQIWRYIKKQSSLEMADRVESVIRDRIVLLSRTPDAGHCRRDLTEEAVKFLPVYSYLIVYRPETKPLQVVSILHGQQDVERILKDLCDVGACTVFGTLMVLVSVVVITTTPARKTENRIRVRTRRNRLRFAKDCV